jgi:hypothetical protein
MSVILRLTLVLFILSVHVTGAFVQSAIKNTILNTSLHAHEAHNWKNGTSVPRLSIAGIESICLLNMCAGMLMRIIVGFINTFEIWCLSLDVECCASATHCDGGYPVVWEPLLLQKYFLTRNHKNSK